MLTVFLALGAWRIARHGVLTRRMPAIETLGAATVLCVDKTGTLTENRMALADVIAARGAARARGRGGGARLRAGAVRSHGARDSRRRRRARRRAAPFLDARARLPVRRRISWRCATAGARLPASGASSSRARRKPCSGCARWTARRAPRRSRRWRARPSRACGCSRWPRRNGRNRSGLPIRARYAFRWLGFVALADPLRAGVPEAVAQCRRAGIRVVMITGDYPGTALAIARQAGIDAGGGALTGAEIAALDAAALAQAVRRVNVFARIRPEQKLRLGHGLQGRRRGGGDDRRRRERRAGAEGRAHRRGHGPARHRRRARGLGAGAARGRFPVDRRRGAPRPAHLREHPQRDALPARGARADRGHVVPAARCSAGRCSCSRCTSCSWSS